MELEKYKARAYDCIAQLNFWQKELEEVNKKIANYKESEVKEEEK